MTSVSIHARRVTGDCVIEFVPRRVDVSIHARRVTGDSCKASAPPWESCFNSRPSCDGRLLTKIEELLPKVSIHARRVTGDIFFAIRASGKTVSIHARRVTGDAV